MLRAGYSDGRGAVGGGESAVFVRRNCRSVCLTGMSSESGQFKSAVIIPNLRGRW